MRPALAAAVLACGLVLAGCIAPGTGDATTPSPSGVTTTVPPPTGSTTATPPTAGNASAGAHVFDQASVDRPVIEGGLVYPADGNQEVYYATLVRNASEATRFDREALPADARQFVDGTDFGSASLVVVQAYPKSSIPDYRVESVTRDGGTVSIRLDDSSDYGTDDVTVETVLIRVGNDGDPPRLARITTQAGVVFDTDDGLVRPASRSSRSSQ